MKLLRSYLAREYGGAKPFLYHLGYLAAYACGSYRPLPSILGTAHPRLVFVCKGNICRSPYAAARARQLGLNAISAGLDTTPGKPAYPTAITAAQRRGLDLSEHRTRLLADIACNDRDLILVMEPAQMALAASISSIPSSQILLAGALFRPRRPFLQDPYGRSEEYFNRCYELIDKSVEELKRLAVAAMAKP